MLSVRGLSAGYGGAAAVASIDLHVAEGACLALLGRNGAGKSTLLKAIMGLVPPSAGTVTFDGRRLDGLPPDRIARAGLGYVPEDRRIFAGLTVAENLETGRRPPRGDAPVWTPARVFALFPALAALRDRPAGRTSGGEQRMLAIARTLMGNPRVLLLDEPSEGLAPVLVEAMIAALETLAENGLALLVSEQTLPVARRLAARAVVLEKGRVRFDGAMADLHPEAALTRELLAL